MNDKCLKLLRLALAPSATSGESDTAATKFIREARKCGETVESLFGPIIESGGGQKEWIFTFGIYRGRTIRSVDTDYLEWSLSLYEISDGLRRAIGTELRRRGVL